MPITIDTPLSAAIVACATVAAGTVKSITTLAAPMAAAASDTIFTPLAPTPATSPASRPSALLPAPSMAPARLQPSVWAICRISIWPMRPAAPAMAIFMSVPLVFVALAYIRTRPGTDMLFMVIEKFRNQDGKAVYRKLRDSGRSLPDGLKFVASYVTADLGRCFQLMETDDVTLFQRWIADWQDVVEFEVVPVVEGKTTREALAPIL